MFCTVRCQLPKGKSVGLSLQYVCMMYRVGQGVSVLYFVFIYIYIYIYTYVCLYIYIYIHIYIWDLYAYIYTYLGPNVAAVDDGSGVNQSMIHPRNCLLLLVCIECSRSYPSAPCRGSAMTDSTENATPTKSANRGTQIPPYQFKFNQDLYLNFNREIQTNLSFLMRWISGM